MFVALPTGQPWARFLNCNSLVAFMKISVTMLSSYSYCQRKLFLENVLRIYEPPKQALVLGSVRHEVFDEINKKEKQIVSSIIERMELEKLKEKYKEEYSKVLRQVIVDYKEDLLGFNLSLPDVFRQCWPIVLEEAETRAKNIFDFIAKHNIFGEELWEKLTPKIESEFRIESDILGLKGIIDHLEKHPEKYVPVELKTGKMPSEGVWPGHKIQIAAYMMLLEEKFNQKVNSGFIYYLDSKQKREIVMNEFLKEEIKDLVGKVKSLFNSQIIPNYCGNPNKCEKCGLKDQCYDEKLLNRRLKELKLS